MKYFLLATLLLLNISAVAAEPESAVKIYGQVSKMLLMYDDGRDTDSTVTDNAITGTKFGVEGERMLGNGLTASFLFEGPLAGTDSGGFTQGTGAGLPSTPVNTAASMNTDFARVGLAGAWGTVLIGKQDTAADGSTKVDVGGASSLLISDMNWIGGGLIYRNSAGATTGVTLNTVHSSLDEENLTDSVRYNSPEWNGLAGSASYEQDGDVEVSAAYTRTVGKAWELASKLGYRSINSQAAAVSNVNNHTVKGSFSAKHESGFAGSVAYSALTRDNKAAGVDDATNLYLKGSYSWDSFAVGADYSQSSDFSTTNLGGDATAMGLAGVYDMGHGVETGVLYKTFSFDDNTAVAYGDIDLLAFYMGVKF